MVAYLLALGLMFGQGVPDAEPTDAEAAYVENLRAGLRECAVTSEPARLGYEDDLQEYEIALEGLDLTEAHAVCLAQSPLFDGATLIFSDTRLEVAYHDARSRRPDIVAAVAEGVAQQRNWLAQQGLLEGMPVFDPTQSLATYVAAVEAHCGLIPGSTFRADETTKSLEIVPDFQPVANDLFCPFTIFLLAMHDGLAPETLILGREVEQ